MCSRCLAVRALRVPTSSLQSAKADARIRTADPFITSEGTVTQPVAPSHSSPHRYAKTARLRTTPNGEVRQPRVRVAHARPPPDSSANQLKSRRFPYDINSGRCETSLNADIVRAIHNPRFPG